MLNIAEGGGGVAPGGHEVEAVHPASPMQQAMLFHGLYAPGSAADMVQAVCDLPGELDAELLRRAWERAAERHPVLRTSFGRGADGAPEQRVHQRVPVLLEELDWRGSAAAELEARFAELLAADRGRGIDPAAPPLMRLCLVRLPGAGTRLLWTVHHALLDNTSALFVLAEVFALYEAFLGGGDLDLPSRRPFSDYVAWVRGRDAAADEAYWRGLLAGFRGGLPLLGTPPARRREGVPEYARLRFRLGEATTAELRRLAAEHRFTLGTLVQGAWAILLGRYGGVEDVVFGATRAGRRSTVEGAAEMVGLFVNTLPVRARVDPDAPLLPWLEALRAQGLATAAHEHAPLADVRRWSGIPGGEPLFESILNFDHASLETLLARHDPAWAERRVRLLFHTEYPLHVGVFGEDALLVTVEYDPERLEPATVEGAMRSFRVLLEGIASDPRRRIADLPLLTAEDRRRLDAWNDTRTELAWEGGLHERVAAQAAATPERVAVACGDASLTYAELDRRANRLANHLRRRGVGPEVRVGVCLERSPELVVALLAVLKAGGAYVPIDPRYPADRVAYMLDDAGVEAVVAEAAALERLGLPAERTVCPGRDAAAIAAEGEAAPRVRVGPGSLAYVIYTSGSTGRPKGAMNEHGAVVNRILWMQREYGLAADDVVLQKTPFSFDVSVWEFFWPLAAGARLVLAKPEGHRDPAYLSELIGREGVTTLHFVPSMLAAFLDGGDPARCGSLRRVVCSGEALPPELMERCLAALPRAELHNLYGPTECAVDVTYWRCEPGGRRVVPIGRPVANTRIHVLDPQGSPVPPGVAGELFIAGVQVGRGYLGRPALTAERFVPDPFAGEPGARMYASGDLARWLPTGELEYLGRLDDQVKIRGFRVEPGEIRAALVSHPAVRDAAVVVREDLPGDPRLVAYVVTGEAAPPAGELRRHLGATLPEHMVPSVFVPLDALPVTAHGKLDRRALPRPDRSRPALEGAYLAPRTPVEELLAETWAEVLGVEGAGAGDDFFELGGHSLLAMQVLSRVRASLGVEVPVRTVFDAPRLGELARRVEGLARAERGTAVPPVRRREGGGEAPLSFAQERLWFLERLAPRAGAYTIPLACTLSGALDARALRRGLGEIVRRHEALRTVFGAVDGRPVQRVQAPSPVPLPVVDLAALAADDRAAESARVSSREARRPFDLGAGPLLRARLLRLGRDEHRLLVMMHHVVSDGWSLGVLFRELGALYEAFTRGAPSPLPALPVQYADYAVWQRERLGEPGFRRQLDYWRGRLADAPAVLALPSDRPRPGVRSGSGAVHAFTVPAETARALQALARREGATPFMVLLAAFEALLFRYTGRDDLMVGSPISGRTSAELEPLIGFFVNMLALRTDLSGDPDLPALVARVREATLDAYANQDAPFEKVVEELRVEGSLAHTPLFQVMFAMQGAPSRGVELGGVSMRPAWVETGTSRFDLSLLVEEADAGLRASLEYDTDLFDAATMERLGVHFRTLLEGIVRDPSLRLSALPLLPPGERAELLALGTRERPAPLPEATLHRLFEAAAARTPDAPAVLHADGRTSFGELDRAADAVARLLRQRGVEPGSLVALCAEPSAGMLAGILGILKAGAAYLPLDPEHPEGRLAAVLRDSGARALLAPGRLLGRLPAGEAERVRLEDAAEWAGTGAPERAAGADDPRAAAYVIYTSGSTGTPKGVVVEHRGVVHTLLAARGALGLGAGDVVSSLAAFTFDISVLELFAPLLAGAPVALRSRADAMDPGRLLEGLAGVTVLHAVPSLMRELVAHVRERGTRGFAPRLLLVGGDAVPPDLLAEMRAAFPAAEVRVLYGPTEASIICATHRVGAGTPRGNPLGRPLEGVSLFVLDAAGELAPRGVPGELCVAGDGVARGYLGRAELTAERFVPDPLSGRPGARMYRTGDRARWDAEGGLEFLGRTDLQVKLRGFRIEPGEVEAALAAQPGVREAAVAVREDRPGEPRLVAYVVPDAAGGPELWPSIGEYFVYDDLIYGGLTGDDLRNARYLAALERHARGGVVLDVGTGADAILARIAVEAGARHVYAVELLERSYLKARERIESLGLQDRITLLHGDARTVALPEPVDVIVSEIVEAIAGGEGAAVVLNAARRHLRPGGVMVPGLCRTRVAAVSLPEPLRSEPRFSSTAAHYVRRIFEEVGRPFDVRLCVRGLPADARVTDTAVFEELDFRAGPAAAEQRRAETLTVLRDGRIDGLLLWLWMELSPGEELDIVEEETAWFPVYFPAFDGGLEVRAGDRIRVACTTTLSDNGVAPDYAVRGVVVRQGREPVEFEHLSAHHGGGFRATPFYGRVFGEDGGPAVSGARVEGPDDDALRAGLRELLPEYMVPSAFVRLDALPLNAHGKTDRRALPDPDSLRAAPRREYTAPRGRTEEVLAEVWGEALGVERAGVDDNFFDLGGHSLLLARVCDEASRRLGREVPVMAMFRHPTIRALAAHLEEGEAAPAPAPGGGDEALEQLRSGRARLRRRAGRA